MDPMNFIHRIADNRSPVAWLLIEITIVLTFCKDMITLYGVAQELHNVRALGAGTAARNSALSASCCATLAASYAATSAQGTTSARCRGDTKCKALGAPGHNPQPLDGRSASLRCHWRGRLSDIAHRDPDLTIPSRPLAMRSHTRTRTPGHAQSKRHIHVGTD